MSIVTKLAVTPSAKFDPTKGSLLICVSAPVPDRDDEIVLPETLRLEAYSANPVILYGHDQYQRMPIAKAESPDGQFRTWVVDGRLWQEWYFANSDDGRAAAALYRDKILRGASIGFKSDGVEDVPPDEAERLYGINKRLRRHVGGELLEVSAVPVPCCPAALASRWVDRDKAASVARSGKIGDMTLPGYVTKSLNLSTRFPASKQQFWKWPAITKRSKTMSQAATTTGTDNTTTKAADDVTTKAVDDGGVDTTSDQDDLEMGDPHEQVKAGLMTAMATCLGAYGKGEMARDELEARLAGYFDDFDKYMGGHEEPDGDEKAEDVEEVEDEEDVEEAEEEKSVSGAILKELRAIKDQFATFTKQYDEDQDAIAETFEALAKNK